VLDRCSRLLVRLVGLYSYGSVSGVGSGVNGSGVSSSGVNGTRIPVSGGSAGVNGGSRGAIERSPGLGVSSRLTIPISASHVPRDSSLADVGFLLTV